MRCTTMESLPSERVSCWCYICFAGPSGYTPAGIRLGYSLWSLYWSPCCCLAMIFHSKARFPCSAYVSVGSARWNRCLRLLRSALARECDRLTWAVRMSADPQVLRTVSGLANFMHRPTHTSMRPGPSKHFRVGLVGAGYVSEFHIQALKRLPHV